MSKRKTITRLFEIWTYRLGLRWWTVNTIYHKGKEARKFFSAGDDETVLARTFSDWRYSMANIHINTPAFGNMTDNEIERVVVHELCHVLVNEMREGEIHHEERVVTGLQKAFLWTVNDAE